MGGRGGGGGLVVSSPPQLVPLIAGKGVLQHTHTQRRKPHENASGRLKAKKIKLIMRDVAALQKGGACAPPTPG